MGRGFFREAGKGTKRDGLFSSLPWGLYRPQVRGAEELRLGDGLDEEGEELPQRHVQQRLGAAWMDRGRVLALAC